MKLLVKKIGRINFFKFLRNCLGIKPTYVDIGHIKENTSLSDAFLWRTDNGFKTTFKFADILNVFYKVKNSTVELIFFDNKNNEIKRVNIKNLNLSNELVIDKKFLNNIEGYGTFYIFHKTNSNFYEKPIIISNRCYLGFSRNDSLNSFVHGNLYAVSKNFNSERGYRNFVKTSYFSNQKYRLQNNFKDFDKTELFFANMTTKNISFSMMNKRYFLSKNSSVLLTFEKLDVVEIKSNCYFLRPLIFNYKDNFLMFTTANF